MKHLIFFLSFLIAFPAVADWEFESGLDLNTNRIIGVGELEVDNLELNGNTVSTTDANGNLIFDANGTGQTRSNDDVALRSGKDLILNDDDNSNTATISVPSNLTGNRTYQVPDLGTFGDFLGTTGAQDVSGKDIDGGTASNDSRITIPKNDTSSIDALTDKEATLVYDTSLDRLKVNDGANWNIVGSGGSGSGDINAVTNPNAETDITGYSDSDAGADVTRHTTAADLALYYTGTQTGIKIDPDASSEYIAYCNRMPEGLKNRKLIVSFWMDYESGYDSGDMKLELYRSANSDCSSANEVDLAYDSSGTSAIPPITSKYYNYADWGSDDYYQIRWVRTNASTEAIYIQNLILGPDRQPTAPPGNDWQTVTCTSTWVSNTTVTCLERRDKDTAFYDVKLALSGAPTSATLEITLPTGRTIDTSKLLETTLGSGQSVLPSFVHIQDATGGTFHGAGFYSSGKVRVGYYDDVVGGVQLSNWVTQALPMTFASGDSVHVKFSVPIAEWAGSAAYSQGQDIEYVSTASFTAPTIYRGQDGSALPTSTPAGTIEEFATATATLWQRPPQQGDDITVQVDRVGNGKWQDLPILGVDKLRNDGTNYIGLGFYVQGTDTYIARGKYRTNSTDTWAGVPSGARYRIKKYSSAKAMFNMASSTEAGLLSAYAEGTWTPAEFGKTNLSGTGTYSSGKYTRIGRQVFATFGSISGYTVTTAANRIDIQITTTGLPNITNTTSFYGGGRALATTGGEEMIPCTFSDASGSNTNVYLICQAGAAGIGNSETVTFSNLNFRYYTDE